MRILTTTFLLLCAGSITVAAQDTTPLFSGPQPGEKLPALKVTLVYGKDTGERVDLVERAAGRPTMLVIVNGSNRPAARLTRALMNFAEMHEAHLFAGVVYLDGDQSAAVGQLKQAVSWWQVGPPVGVSIDGAEGPGSYGLNRNVNVTVLVANEGRVVRNHALVQPSGTDAPKILKDVVALAGGRVPSNAEVMFLSAPTHKLPAANWRSAPSDVTFRELICAGLAAKDDDTASRAADAVETYVGTNRDRQIALGSAAAILSEGRTRVRGQPIVKHLARWRTKYDPRGKKKLIKTPVLFDLGTKTSPVAESAIRATSESHYDSQTGFGWITTGHASFDRDEPLPELKHGGNPIRPDLLYRSHANESCRDGVASDQDMRFRIDLNPGQYRVHVWVGDLHAPLESLAMECNGTTIATAVSAKHLIGRSKPESTGFYRLLRFDAEATDGKIELRFYGDETQYTKDMDRYQKWFPDDARVDSYMGSPWDKNRQLKFDPGGSFTRNSVLAIRVVPARGKLIRWDRGKLTAVGKDTGNRDAFVAALNQGDFSESESILNADSTTVDLRLWGWLALLGHPDVRAEAEQRALVKVQQAVAAAMTASPPNLWAIEARDSLDIFSRARRRFLNRGMGEEGHFQENRKVVSMMRIFRPEDLLYYKALEYQGRALQMLDPHRWVYPSGDAAAVWRKLIAAFPNNPYARFYLDDQWEANVLWHYADHRAGTDGAPQWAIAQREAWGMLLDVCEWWAANKQHPDGSIGGGWGDDVELVALFGVMGFISDGASDASLNLASDLINGLWRYGGIDQTAGFYRGLLDAEHSAEWTGDSLPLTLTIDWGNPIWIERATQSATLMRDLWMDYNDRGDLHFRSNFLSSVSIGNETQANDSYINIRAALPAIAVYRYNRSPVIGKLLVEWADAWLNDAMRTDRDKPLGVFPAEVGFPDGQLGGVNSPNWYTAAHPEGSINYDWQRGQYYGYLVDLMLLAHEISGNNKYLEPLRLQKRLVDQYRANPEVSPNPGTGLWVGKSLSDSTRRRASSFDAIWQRIEKAQTSTNTDAPPMLLDKADVLKRMDAVRRETQRKWPVLTTETSATDRVGFRGIADPFFVMTGTQDFKPSVTYSGVGKNFAAFVKQTDERLLKIVMYNFATRKTEASITPWKLEVGGTYRIRTGIDTDDDDESDENVVEDSFVLNRQGQRIGFTLAPRTTTIIEVRQTKAGRGSGPRADLAVISQELKYSIWTHQLQVTIHNVGAQAARKFGVTFYDGMEKIGEITVPHLSWPLDLSAKSLTVSIPYVPTRNDELITVVVDEDESISEVCESNNRASRRFEFDLGEIRAPRERVGEIGGDVSGEIDRGIR